MTSHIYFNGRRYAVQLPTKINPKHRAALYRIKDGDPYLIKDFENFYDARDWLEITYINVNKIPWC